MKEKGAQPTAITAASRGRRDVVDVRSGRKAKNEMRNKLKPSVP